MPLKANNYFATLAEPDQSCLLFLHGFILEQSPHITHAWKFNTPFYYYKGRWLCFISYCSKTSVIYISFVNGFKMNHPKLLREGRKKMKVFYVDANEDVPVRMLGVLMQLAINVSGV